MSRSLGAEHFPSPFTGACDSRDIRSFYTSELAYLRAIRQRYACQFCGTSKSQCSSCSDLDERIEQLEATPPVYETTAELVSVIRELGAGVWTCYVFAGGEMSGKDWRALSPMGQATEAARAVRILRDSLSPALVCDSAGGGDEG